MVSSPVLFPHQRRFPTVTVARRRRRNLPPRRQRRPYVRMAPRHGIALPIHQRGSRALPWPHACPKRSPPPPSPSHAGPTAR
nr:unnamed protein product [Digitaria exilis]